MNSNVEELFQLTEELFQLTKDIAATVKDEKYLDALATLSILNPLQSIWVFLHLENNLSPEQMVYLTVLIQNKMNSDKWFEFVDKLSQITASIQDKE